MNHILKNISSAIWQANCDLAAARGIYQHPRSDNRATTHRNAGKMKRGSVRGLLEHLASGNAIYVMIADDTEYAAANKIRKLAKRENLNLLNRVADALEQAEKRNLQYNTESK